MRDVKLKLDSARELKRVRLARRILGRKCSLRVDANMSWSEEDARRALSVLERSRVAALEQPLPAENIDGAAMLVREGSVPIVADESISSKESLQELLARDACDIANIRISKCGGLVGSYRRALEALGAGKAVQVGCQVGESSLLSAANLALIAAIEEVRFAEGCFGLHLLKEDPARPLLQFSYGGKPPALPQARFGFGVEIDEAVLRAWTVRRSAPARPEGERPSVSSTTA